MKNLKLIMIAALIGTAIVNQAATDGFQTNPSKKVIDINIIQAMQIPALVDVIHNQVDATLLYSNQQIYTIDVAHKNNIFKITGSYDQWVWFFAPYLQYLGKKHNNLRSR